jgi:CDP-diacylglycerol--glycerol-3-phosphate 3-phosphatidyltransferase
MLGFGAYAVGEALLYVAAALTLWSMIEYLRAALPAMRGAEDSRTRS